jgi:hypothetical protein
MSIANYADGSEFQDARAPMPAEITATTSPALVLRVASKIDWSAVGPSMPVGGGRWSSRW